MSMNTIPQSTAKPSSTGFTRRELVVGGALVASALAASLVKPSPDRRSGRAVSLKDLVPDRVGPWRGSRYGNVLIPKGEDAYKNTYDDVLTRHYTSESAAPIMFLIAYGSAQTGNTELHRPEVCYPAAGFRIRSWPDLQLKLLRSSVTARSFTAFASGRVEQILYWSRVGDDFPTSSLEQRWSVLRHTIRGSVPDGILVRISTIDSNRERAIRLLQTFAQTLLSSGGPEMRLLLTGKA